MDVAVGPDGTIYVLDRGASAVRVFGPDGEYLRSIGRRGEGPGEFRRPVQMTLAPDGTLWVFDDGSQALLALAPDGTEVARHHAAPPPAPHGGATPGLPSSSTLYSRFNSDGAVTQIVQHGDPLPSPVATGVWDAHGRIFIRSLDPLTGAADSVHVGDHHFRRLHYRMGGSVPIMGTVGFDPRRLTALDERGGIWTALSTEYVLRRVTNGDSLVVRVDAEAAPFNSEERSFWEGPPRELAGALPERGHLLWRLFTDDRNRLWVHRAEGFQFTGQLDVFREDGQLLGSVVLPGRLAFNGLSVPVAVRDGYIYAVVSGELNVWKVIRAPLPTWY